MKRPVFYYIALPLAVGMLSSCSLGTKIKSYFVSDTIYAKAVEDTDSTSITVPTTVLQEIHSSSKSEATHATKVVDTALDGEWTITTVYSQKVNLATLPYLEFSNDNNKAYASTGCNMLNADYNITAQGGISFSNVIISQNSCTNDKYETQITKAIQRATTYNYGTSNGLRTLNLIDKKGVTVMSLRQHNLNELNGAWRVVSIGSTSTEANSIRFVIDIQSQRIHCNSGCNIINGEILLDAKKLKAVQFSNLISTRKMCKDINIETDLLVALEEAEYYNAESESRVVFTNGKGSQVFTIERTSVN